MKTFFFLLVVILAGGLALHQNLQNGHLLNYLDTHPDPRWVPATEYYVGEGYFIFQDLDQAATYFIRVPERYPQSSLADDATWNYLEALDAMTSSSRSQLIEEYGKYAERFPNGAHLRDAQNKIDAYKSGVR